MTHPKDCPICAAINPALTNTENARRLDTSEATIRRHRASNPPVDEFFGVPNEIITSRGKTVRLPDGSYEKITYSPARAALLEVASYDDIERAIENYVFTPPSTDMSTYAREAFNLCLADFQVGKTDAQGGTAELELRVMGSLYAARERVLREKPAEINLFDLGDGIEGFSNTGGQAQTNDLNLTTQIRVMRRLMTEAIKMFAPLTPNLNYIAVPSNHCQVRAPGSKDLASTPNDDFGIEVSHQLEDVFADREQYSHLSFHRPTEYEEALTIGTIDGTAIGAVHGHQGKSPETIAATWWTGQSHGRRSGLDRADILLYGHFHGLRVQHSGDSRWAIGAPTSDNGSSWYANMKGVTSKTGMLGFTSSNGMWKGIEIL